LAQLLNLKEEELAKLLDEVVDGYLGMGKEDDEKLFFEIFELTDQYTKALKSGDHKSSANLKTKLI